MKDFFKSFGLYFAVFTVLCIGLLATVSLADGTEVPVRKDTPVIAGQPLTAVVVTQCNGLLAVYMTMPDGRLVRFDQSSGLPVHKLLMAAYAAKRSERIEIACDGTGIKGYEEKRT